jgi:hypothetical protein
MERRNVPSRANGKSCFPAQHILLPGAEQLRPNESIESEHVANRGSSRQAATLLRGILAHDERPATAHETAEMAPRESLPARVCAEIQRRTFAVRDRRSAYQSRRAEIDASQHTSSTDRVRDASEDRSFGDGLEL